MQGRLELLTLRAPSLDGNPLGDPAERPLHLYLPPGHDGARERFPVVYFLHGFFGTADGWVARSPFQPTVPERLDALVAAGVIPPVVAAFPDGFTALGGSQWVNSEASGRYEDYLARDVVAAVDARARTVPAPEARALVGKSSGGYGALSVARHRPDVFGHLAAHSADAAFEYCYLPDLPRAAAALEGTDPASWHAEFLRRARETKPRSDDHAVLTVLAMAAAYSPRAGQPLGLELPFEPGTARLRTEVWERWLAHDPVRFAPRSLEAFRRLGSVFVDCGRRDEYQLRWGARQLVETLRQGGVAVVHEEFDDGHRGTSYRYDRSLAFLAPRLARG
ncbi:alpha/beta hydrolase [Anaeromyxobacter paludicola]|uniref:Enterochelin esterase n=1 Tax=Anaeromyxobacter paludicola TaxID=2918171 RepID=A0ABM7XF22_9BACT|nr:alpha/beta hydrolase-fold protein [Anaeromyxobacter paludicola]BDG10487.1 enterochelin esterase [Anaeromyxobacter paludicola]